MAILFVFAAFVFVGDVVAVGISSIVERYSHYASLLVFLGLFMLVFYIAWKLAVMVTERYLSRQN
ncbi:MAG: hypothetical protein AB1490_16555 [Pseudomonadota bacterium]